MYDTSDHANSPSSASANRGAEFEYQIDDRNKRVTSVWRGRIAIEDIARFLAETWKKNPKIGDYSELVDLTAVESIAFGQSELTSLASLRRNLDGTPCETKIALVVNRADTEAMARDYRAMLQQAGENETIEVGIFHDMDKATRWIA